MKICMDTSPVVALQCIIYTGRKSVSLSDLLGLEFSGRDSKKEAVMGITGGGVSRLNKHLNSYTHVKIKINIEQALM